ncbi:MAG TPA: hypothetical protein VL261_01270 [Nitrospira sp.]|jgi:hypothetical protein|nr:hypothetical protein [Nitrospira sp.]
MNHESYAPRSAASRLFRLGARKRLLLVAASLLLAYAIALVTFLIRWMHFWMRGPYFFSYIGVFLGALALLLFWWTSRHHTGPLPVLSTLTYAVAAGYLAGLSAMICYPLFQRDGFQHMLLGFDFPTFDAAVAFFWFPVRLGTWLFGGLSGATMLLLSRRWRRMKQA